MTEPTFEHTSVGGAASQIRRNPRLVVPFARSALRHRVIGPLTSRGRPGAVAVFHTGRCGSTVLSDVVGQHPDVYWDGETYGRVIEEVKRVGAQRSEVDFDPVAYVAGRLNRSGRKWFAYDLKFSHITEFGMTIEEYVSGLDRIGVGRIVGLRRKNFLRQVVSSLVARQRRQFHFQNSVGELDTIAPVRIDVDGLNVDLAFGTLLELFETWDACYAEFDRVTSGRDVLWLTYEDDIEADPHRAATQVIEFLGLPPRDISVRLQKITKGSLASVLGNVDEVRDHLAGSRYAWMAEE